MRPRLPTKSQLDDAAEAGPDDPLGQIAFAYDRSDDVPLEKNTSRENELEKHIANHFSAAGSELTQGDIRLILGFLRDKKYTKIFKRPPADIEFLYRGMAVSDSWLKKALNFGPNDTLRLHGFRRSSFTFKPKPHLPATAWSTSQHLAYQFGHGATMELNGFPNAVVLTAQAKENNFIAGPDGLYKLKFNDDYAHENEYVGLGIIKVTEIRWEG